MRDGEQFVGDFDAGDAASVEEAGHAAGQDEDIGDDRHLETVQGHVLEQFVLLAGVVADLVDDEASAGADLFGQLEILRHDLGFEPLVVVDYGTKKKAGGF